MSIKNYLLLAMLTAFMAFPSVASAWPSDSSVNTPITVAADDQGAAVMVEDGVGGAIIAWTDYRNVNDRDIYAQRIDATGAVQWTINGVAVCTATGHQNGIHIIDDGTGGTILAWSDARVERGQVYAQRMDADGNAQWASGGVYLSEMNSPQAMISDGAGGVIIAWKDTANDVYAQRINASGTIEWVSGGNRISEIGAATGIPLITSDGNNGAIITWPQGSGSGDAFAQRVDASGNIQWATGGVPVAADPAVYESVNAITGDESGGAVIFLVINGRGYCAQKLDASGTTQWPTAVWLTNGDANNASYPFISDGLGGALVSWWTYSDFDVNNDRAVYVQGVDANGNIRWPSDGLLVGHRPYGSQGDTVPIVSDSTGGFIAAWETADSDWNMNVLTQYFSSAGLPQWGESPVQISTNSANQKWPAAVSDGAGGAIFVWQDQRNGEDNDDLYAHRISVDGGSYGIQTPANISPDNGAHVDAVPTLTASAFTDDAGLVNHAASQWRIHSINNVTPETPDRATTGDDGYFTYQLPFSFPFFERNITSISVNTNGLIELLEDGETDYANDRYGTHSEGEHIDNMDAIFAANDDLDLINGYLRLYNAGTHVAIEWYGDTYLDADADPNYPDVTNSLLFQVVLHQDGKINWNFSQLGFTLFDHDMYSGVYPNGGTEISMISGSLADVNTPSAFEFNPVTRAITPSTYAWFTPKPVMYDSGIITDLVSHLVPDTAGLEDAVTYYWGVRYMGDNDEWSLWSMPTRFVADILAPTITAREPENDTIDVVVNTVVRATFSEEMAAGTIDASSFTLSGPDGNVSGTVGYAATVASLTPDVDLDFNTTYTATITLDVTDTTDKPMALPHTWSFTTGAEVDVTPPLVEVVVPGVDAVDIAIDIGSINVSFNEPMNALTINQSSYTLTGPDGSVTGTWSYEVPSNTARIDPDTLLAYSTTYTVAITTDITDNAGNGLATGYSWTFTTVEAPPPPPLEDSIPPRVVSVTPSSSPVPASIEAITITFSEPIQNIDTTSFIVRASESVVPGSVQYDEAAMTAWFYPATDLAFNTQYSVRIISNLIRDLADNDMEQDYVLFFTTGGDPALGGCDPELGQEEGCENFDYFSYGTGVDVNTYGSSISGFTGEGAARRSVSLEVSFLDESAPPSSSFESQAIARVDNTDFSLRSRSKRMESTADRAGAWSIGASKITVKGVPPGTVIPMSIVVSGNFTGPSGTLLLQVRDFDDYRMLGTASVTNSGNPFTFYGNHYDGITFTQIIDPFGDDNDPSNVVKSFANSGNGFRLDFPYAVIPNNGIYVWFVAGVISNDGTTTGETDFTARLEVNPPPGVTVTLASGQVFTGAVDTDGDGVSDLEDSSPNDATIASPASATGTGSIAMNVSSTGGATLSQVQTLDEDDFGLIQDNKPTDQEFPDGLVSFRINGVEPGGTATVTLTFPTKFPQGTAYYKVDETGFHEFLNPTEFLNAMVDDYTIALQLEDGGSGDADGVANGVILDPGGIAISNTGASDTGSGSGGSSGCFVSTLSP